MNWQVSTRANIYTRILIFALLSLFISNAFAQWRVDMSRRLPPKPAKSVEETVDKAPAMETVDVTGRDESVKAVTQSKAIPTPAADWSDGAVADGTKKAVPVLKEAPTAGEGVQELVVLNTEKGFVPSALRLRQGAHYKLYVVNINEKEKNVSFILDAFAENHSTFFGQPKVIDLFPQRDGVFQFQCPETAVQGRIVVMPNTPAEDSARVPASKDTTW